MIVIRVYISMIEILDSEDDKNHARCHDNKSIYDVNYEESTSFSCPHKGNEILIIIWLTILELKFIYTHCISGVPNISSS